MYLVQKLPPMWRISLEASFDLMRFCALEFFQRFDACLHKTSDPSNTNALQLAHMIWAVIPCLGTETSLHQQSVAHRYRIPECNLTINDAPYEACDMLEH